MLAQIVDGRTDLVFDYIAVGHSPAATDGDGVSLLQWCAYYGDVSAIKFLLASGESLSSLGVNFDLNGASYHGHWRLCQFLIERGADVNLAQADTGETPLHSAMSKTSPAYNTVLRVLLAHGADPNRATNQSIETGAFMRDCRTKGETPLHRAAAFADEEAIQMLLSAGAIIDARDMFGDTPLSWASWHVRATPILRLLCYGPFRIHPANQPMDANLRGKPHAAA